LVSHVKGRTEIEGESKMLGRMFGSKRDDATGGWGILHNEELHNLYSSPNIIRIIKSRRMIRAGHVAYVRKLKISRAYIILVLKLE
jgi:hypothetical protein